MVSQQIIAEVSAETIAAGLDKGRRVKPDEYKACCPAHDDNNPSLSISQKADRVLVHCWSGCSQSEVIQALRDRGLWHQGSRRKGSAFTSDELEYMTIWCATFRDNTASGYQPRPEEKQKFGRYNRALERTND